MPNLGRGRVNETRPFLFPFVFEFQDTVLVDSFPGNESGNIVQALPGYQTGLWTRVKTGTNLPGNQVERCRLHQAGTVA